MYFPALSFAFSMLVNQTLYIWVCTLFQKNKKKYAIDLTDHDITSF